MIMFWNCWREFDRFYLTPTILYDRECTCLTIGWLWFEIDIG